MFNIRLKKLNSPRNSFNENFWWKEKLSCNNSVSSKFSMNNEYNTILYWKYEMFKSG